MLKKSFVIMAASLAAVVFSSCTSMVIFDDADKSLTAENSAILLLEAGSRGTGLPSKLRVSACNGSPVDWKKRTKVRVKAGEVRLTIDFADTFELESYSGFSIGGSGYVVLVKQANMEIRFSAKSLPKNKYYTIATTGVPSAGISVSGGGESFFFPIDASQATIQRAQLFGFSWGKEEPLGQLTLKKQP
ncbi:MAG: hypothetical protein Ta2A_05270 [Treponemataceae bacterium]|nr:MAG: hypothetical protein Ta2A_05270 [Treponemataceae bacterium]